ncbi:efflux RND transporter periplasmic adaptor subunit [Budvicia aquatica]|uniref:Efflux RND transporter periplasmic adaptor subunit n=2 Tax=Enterobacterales TaxID=91347 RepID=A0A2C6DM30_9GAMM|nr:efflux RND transporter periplasmic adaptor subunit [Budvicia aquatica]PHI29861.1 efflux RND transporter periplasmic adaptor subunit [Budvicia aquatica]GKX51789.1 lipoprotein [Budvicia aquatica]
MNIKLVAVLLVTIFLSACDREAPEKSDGVRPVSIFDVINNAQQGERVFPARIVAGDKTELAFKRPGQLQQLLVREGERVTQGQLIAELNNNDARLRVKDRQATFDLAQTQFNRLSTLSARNVIPRAELDVQRAARDSARAALNIAQEELSFMQVLAPFDGIIANVNARNHQVVTAGQPIAILNSLDSLDVVFSIPENLFIIIDENNAKYQPTVQLNNLPGRDFAARYKEHTTNTTSGSLTYQMTLTMPRPSDLPLLSGMSGSVRINLGNLSGAAQTANIVIPVEAVFNPDNTQRNQPYVWVVKQRDGKLFVELRKVETGQLTANGIQILSGLNDGERIVAAGTRELRPDQEVRAWVRERGL